MKTYEYEFQCPSCGEVETLSIEVTDHLADLIDSGEMELKEATKPGTFEREVFISGLCFNCQEKVFNRPAPEHEDEWGDLIGECGNCGCSLYRKDMDAGECPSCREKLEDVGMTV